LGEIVHESLAGPPFSAIHTVCILCRVAQIALRTASTHVKLAKGAPNACMVRLVK